MQLPPLVDVHAHLYPPNFSLAELPDILRRARAVGVRGIVTVPETALECAAVLELANSGEFPEVWPCAGLHPVQKETVGDVTRDRPSRLADLGPTLGFIREHHESLIAVGEVGLDYTPHVLHPGLTASEVRDWKKSPLEKDRMEKAEREAKEEQREVFRQQAQLAMELGLPVNVHSRSAGKHAVEVLRELNVSPDWAILHAFDGSVQHALTACSHGYLLSIPPSSVRSPQRQSLIAAVPITNLLLETDSPALAPEPGGRNTPDQIRVSLDEIVRRKKGTGGGNADDVARIIFENTGRVFRDLDKWLTRSQSRGDQ